MNVSTKGRYGVRFMMDLAMHCEGGNIKLKDVSARQHISEKYLWQVVNPLKKAGLVFSTSGPGGGYVLARDAGAITLLDVLRVLEGDSTLVNCADQSGACERGDVCAARLVWREIGDRIAAELDAITLRALAARQQELESGAVLNYVI